MSLFKSIYLSDENPQSTTLCKCPSNLNNSVHVVVSNNTTNSKGPTAHKSVSSGDHLTALIT